MTLLLSRGAGPMPETRLKMAAVAANVQRAEKVGRAQADLARRAVQTLREADERGHRRWIDALQHRVDHPTFSLRQCGETMTPPMSKHQYSALLRRALLAAQTLESEAR